MAIPRSFPPLDGYRGGVKGVNEKLVWEEKWKERKGACDEGENYTGIDIDPTEWRKQTGALPNQVQQERWT